MDKKNYVSFNEFRDKAQGKNVDRRSTTEILNEIDEVEKKFKKGGEK